MFPDHAADYGLQLGDYKFNGRLPFADMVEPKITSEDKAYKEL
jgi:hypothetical protein